jgi:CRP-like cAMP-binding protein
MIGPRQPDIGNHLLRLLAVDDFARLAPNLKLVSLHVSDVLEFPDEVIEHLYFPESGMVSIVASASPKQRIEVGVIGSEGMSGLAVVLGTDRAPENTFVQIAGSAWKIPAQDMRTAIDESRLLHRILLLYARAHAVQVAQSALAYGRYSLEERLARWILMSQDRVHHGPVCLTHEFLSLMLGTRRAGVTTAMHILEGIKAIEASRGAITVLSREKLKNAAAGSYGGPEAEYERLLGKSKSLQLIAN